MPGAGDREGWGVNVEQGQRFSFTECKMFWKMDGSLGYIIM